MTYILSAISVGSESGRERQSGGLTAEPDEPSSAILELVDQQIRGARYLIVADDGAGYKSSMQLAQVPHSPTETTRLVIPGAFEADFWKLLGELQQQSPAMQLAVYLEANRILSRPLPGDPHPARATLIRHESLKDFARLTQEGQVYEEEVHFIGL